MAYPGWLSIGGNEIFNSPRALGYSLGADCPAAWFRSDGCTTLADALGHGVYDGTSHPLAPWYDEANPGISSRFFGLYGLSLDGIDDTDLDVQVTEGLRDGGIIGRTRLSTKKVRARGFMLAKGRDALEHGMTWLRGSLSPNACGRHGGQCGTTDATFFVDCPPKRPDLIEWSPGGKNIALNPALRAESENRQTLRTNFLRNPVFEEGIAGWAATSLTTISYNTSLQMSGSGCLYASGSRGTTYQGAYFSPVTMSDIQPGDRVRGGAWVKILNGDTQEYQITVTSLGDEGVQASTTFTPTGDWQYVQTSSSAVVGSTQNPYLLVRAYGGSGDVEFLIDSAIVCQEGEPVIPFSGNDPSDGYFEYEWTGTPNNSSSIQTAPVPASVNHLNYWGSWQWFIAPDGIARLTPMSEAPDVTGLNFSTPEISSGLYTLLLDVRAVGGDFQIQSVYFNGGSHFEYPAAIENTGEIQRIRIVGNGGDAILRFMQIGFTAGSDESGIAEPGSYLEIHSIAVIPGDYSGEYFDGGATPPNPLVRYSWEGAPNDSASIREVGEPYPMPDDEFDDLVIEGMRYLHEVGVTSGPLVIEDFYDSRTDMYGREVEFTFEAGRPHVYGATRARNLPAASSTIVEDIRYNLAPVPRVGHGTPRVQTDRPRAVNFMRNPSLETATTHVTTSVSAVSGSSPTARFTSGRSTDLAAVGDYSMRARLLGSTASTASGRAEMKIRQDSDTIDSRRRVMASVWAAVVVTAGTAHSTIHSLTVRIEQFRHTYAALQEIYSETTTDASEFGGKLFQLPEAVFTDDTSNFYITVTADVSWNSGTVAANNSDIRLYADAFFVGDA